MPCPEQTRLVEDFDEADRAWLASRTSLDDDALHQAGLDALASRNAAANRLYDHRLSCPVCKNSFIKDRRTVDRT